MQLRTAFLALAFSAAALPLAAQQGRPQIRLDDAVAANTPDGFDIHLDSEGDLWVASWVDERDPINTFDDDIFMVVSTDGGLTWGPEIQVTFGSASAIDTDDNWLEVAGGTIYVSFDDDTNGTADRAVVMASTDNGLTFSTFAYPGALHNPFVYADGDNVMVLMYEDGSSPNPLWADYSTTGFAGLGVNPLVQINNVGADVDAISYDGYVDGSTGHIALMDDFNLAFDDDLWYVSLDFTTGIFSAPVQVNSSVHDVDTKAQVVADGGTVHFAWYADDNIGASSAFDDVVHYRSYDIGTATFGTEVQLSSLLDDSDYFQLDAEGSNVLVAFSDDSGLDDWPYAAVSTDGGATFTTTVLPQFASGPMDSQWMNCAVRGEYMFVIGEDDSFNANSIDELPTFWYSNNTGTTWYGPFLLGQNFETDEDIDTEDTAWNFTDTGLAGIWQTDGGTANPDMLMYSAIDFPYAELDYVTGLATFTQVGNPASTAGNFSRWGVSTALGSQVHPENPALTVGLGASSVYNITTNVPPVPPVTGSVDAFGASTKVLGVTIPPGTYYVQAWTNIGSLVGGTHAGEIFTITI